ncbi:MAG: hypothetical protein ABSA97_13315 [Verrucomicrobiia bacterium]|jgi:hypothetical protein
MAGRLGKFAEAVDMEKVLPIATTKGKRMRFAWEALLSKEFLMNWNHCMEPNSMFIEGIDEQRIAVTLRWALVNEPPEKIRERLNRWLEMVEQGKFRRSGQPGKHL